MFQPHSRTQPDQPGCTSTDSKSGDRKIVWVRVLPPAQASKSGGPRAPCRFELDLRYFSITCQSSENLDREGETPAIWPGPFTATVLQPGQNAAEQGRISTIPKAPKTL